MNLLSPRLLRSFAIGFVLGAIGVATLALAERSPGSAQVVPSAIAAPVR
ncbi:MAG: hypothetical protein KGN34_08690 [Sphingomonadales bacterium]|nr:hypothetical protein [Sphingomonadales bacterium]